MTVDAEIIDRLIAAYNSSDAEAFAALFDENAMAIGHPDRVLQRGRAEIRAHYTDVFARYPENRTRLVHRIVIGDRVIDHEQVRRSADSEPFDVAVVYTLANGLIQRVDFISQAKAGE